MCEKIRMQMPKGRTQIYTGQILKKEVIRSFFRGAFILMINSTDEHILKMQTKKKGVGGLIGLCRGKRYTYIGDKSKHILRSSRGAIKVEVAPKGIKMNIVQDIADRMDSTPDNERHAHPTV